MRMLLLIILLGMLVAVGYFAYSAMAVGGDRSRRKVMWHWRWERGSP